MFSVICGKGRWLVYFDYMKEMPIQRFDVGQDGVSVQESGSQDNSEKEAEFKRWASTELDIGLGALSPHEVFYTRRAYESSDDQGKKNLGHFLGHYEIAGSAVLVAAEYHPEITNTLVSGFATGKGITGDELYGQAATESFYVYERTQKGKEFRAMLQEFSLLFSSIEDVTALISESDLDCDKKALSEQLFEAFARKGADLVKFFTMIQEGDLRASEYNVEDVNTAMKAYSRTLLLLRNFFYTDLRENGAQKFEKYPVKKGQSPKYKVTDKFTGFVSEMKWFIRPQADKDGQARISVEINFDTESPDPAFKELFEQTTTRLKDGQAIKEEKNSTFRLSVDRDTTNPEQPIVSLDIGRAQFSGTTFIRTGDKFGNMLATVSTEANHTPFSFDPNFAQEDIFGSIASKFEQYISGPQTTESQTEHQM